MVRHPIRRFFELSVLYIVIIFGIFALQFRSRSVISKNFGALRLTISQNTTDNAEFPYADNFQVSLKGLTVFSNKSEHIKVTHSNGKIQDVIFTNFQQLSPNSVKLFFTHDISLICESSGENNDNLVISANFSPEYINLILPYSHSGNHTITELKDNYAILRSKDLQSIISAPFITADTISFFQNQRVVSYAPYNPDKAFSFTQLATLSAAQTEAFNGFSSQITNKILLSFVNFPDTADELAVSSYIAIMAKQGKYIEAINNIPTSYKNGTRRTYLTAPQLNNLEEMNKNLIMYNENMTYKMNHAFSTNSFDIFEVNKLYEFLYRQNTETIEKLLNLPVNNTTNIPTLEQAIGILETYCYICNKIPSLTSKLQTTALIALKIIEQACSYKDNILILQDNNQIVPITTAIKAGCALKSYGELTKASHFISSGYLLIISHSQLQSQYDINTLGYIYTTLNKDNSFIPHEVVLKPNSKNKFWAWTIAEDLTCSVDNEGTISIVTTFPQGTSHYMILTGIEPFTSIEIYGMPFRTDHRFENYNSSGYIYNAKTKSLLLKQRHKGSKETIRLYYKPKAEQSVKSSTKNDQNNEDSTKEESETTPPTSIESDSSTNIQDNSTQNTQ